MLNGLNGLESNQKEKHTWFVELATGKCLVNVYVRSESQNIIIFSFNLKKETTTKINFKNKTRTNTDPMVHDPAACKLDMELILISILCININNK